MSSIHEVEEWFKDYTRFSYKLLGDLGKFFLKEGFSVTVSITNQTQIELLYKVHLEDLSEMELKCEAFRDFLEKVCDEFSLEEIYSESCVYRKSELPKEYSTFRYEKVILGGIKND